MSDPHEPARHLPPAGQPQMPPTDQFSQMPGGQSPPPPPGMGPPPAPGQFFPPPVPKKRPSWLLPTLLGVGAFVVLCCGGSMVMALTGEDKKPEATSTDSGIPAAKKGTSSASAAAPAASAPVAAESTAAPVPAKPSAAPAPAKPKSPGIGDKVRGGDFEFTVKNVKCGISRVGNDFLNTKAQGTFCKVGVTVKNVTKSARTFHADGTITAQDASGGKYEADGKAGIYGNSDGQGFLDKINPGNSVTANVYFDVPKGTKLKTITLDAGVFTFAQDAVITL
ncbi:DUF4352 domain-containing protein [Micromonospora matsumotoense]|uniref:DUF4352 domain-containing protein n=1 Tax=Micromonospora matsumotoense TaxID=121616 RepID=UPI0033E9A3FF